MIFVTSSSAPQVWAVMSACNCRQSGSLTLGNVKHTMNVNSVWTKCSQDPVNSPSGRARMWQAQRQVPASHSRECKDWKAYLQPPFLPGAFLQGKAHCCSRKVASRYSCSTKGRSVSLAPAMPVWSKAMVWLSIVRMLFCSWSSLLLALR